MRWAVSILACAIIVALGRAAPPEAALQDLWLTLRARQVLLEDEALGKLNLGVKVRNRIATLWGPVPRADLALRAEARLRGLIELVDVRNDLLILPEKPFETPEVQPPPAFLPQRTPPALPAPRPFL